MLEREMVDMFMSTLQGPYYDRMVGSTSVGFSELVMDGERIEAGLKAGKIQSTSSSGSGNGAIKKPFGGYVKKKEGETSVVYPQRGGGRPVYPQQRHQQVNVVAIPVIAPPRLQQQPLYQQQNYRQQLQQQPPQNFQQPRRN